MTERVGPAASGIAEYEFARAPGENRRRTATSTNCGETQPKKNRHELTRLDEDEQENRAGCSEPARH